MTAEALAVPATDPSTLATPTLRDLRAALREQIHATAAEIRLLKRFWRTPPARRTEPPLTRFDLGRSKLRATLLCMLMAHSRHRRHLPIWRSAHPERCELPDRAAEAALIERELARMDDHERGGIVAPLLDSPLRAAARAILGQSS